ncbi:hypothetical protein G6F65_018575 [Rhizopus arrhizus]|nr:hypothetical protein G6F65_018575 [Rhizopus arrhizus]
MRNPGSGRVRAERQKRLNSLRPLFAGSAAPDHERGAVPTQVPATAATGQRQRHVALGHRHGTTGADRAGVRPQRHVLAEQVVQRIGAGEAALAVDDLRFASGQATAGDLDAHRNARAVGALDGAGTRGGLVEQRPAGQVVAQVAVDVAGRLRRRSGQRGGEQAQGQQQGEFHGVIRREGSTQARSSRWKASASSIAGKRARCAASASAEIVVVTTCSRSRISTCGWPRKSITALSPAKCSWLPSTPMRLTAATKHRFSMARARSSVFHA